MRDDAEAHTSSSKTLSNEDLGSKRKFCMIEATAENPPYVDIHDIRNHLPLPHIKLSASSFDTSTRGRAIDSREVMESGLASYGAAARCEAERNMVADLATRTRSHHSRACAAGTADHTTLHT